MAQKEKAASYLSAGNSISSEDVEQIALPFYVLVIKSRLPLTAPNPWAARQPGFGGKSS
jgi:hypothetical protein